MRRHSLVCAQELRSAAACRQAPALQALMVRACSDGLLMGHNKKQRLFETRVDIHRLTQAAAPR